jgi:hypothetical protein
MPYHYVALLSSEKRNRRGERIKYLAACLKLDRSPDMTRYQQQHGPFEGATAMHPDANPDPILLLDHFNGTTE